MEADGDDIEDHKFESPNKARRFQGLLSGDN